MANEKSYAPLGTEERKRLEKAIGDFLEKASKHSDVLHQSLYSWLTTTESGRKLIAAVTDHKTARLRHQLERPIPVVLLLHNDGWMEVYGTKNLNLMAYTMPWWGGTEDDAALQRDCVEMCMPEEVEQLMWPNAVSDNPGKIKELHVTQIDTEHDGQHRKLYTWRECANTWNFRDAMGTLSNQDLSTK